MFDNFKLEHYNNREGSIFYKYRFNKTLFSFCQRKNGDVLNVAVIDLEYPEAEFYADGTKERYYPDRIRFIIPSKTIASYEDEEEFNRMFQYLRSVRSELDRFFALSNHARLWWDNHKGENK